MTFDWSNKYLPNGGSVDPTDPNKIAGDALDKVGPAAAIARSALRDRGGVESRVYMKGREFKIFIDGRTYYGAPYAFMSKTRPDEVCHPSDYVNTPTYRCDEGQRRTQDCHLFIFNDRFEEVGYHRIESKEPYPFFCNAVLAVGTADKQKNELLVTIQYFPIDRKAASRVADIGSGWSRMTVLLRLHPTGDGKVRIEQDDGCLKNPNRIETVPYARQALRRCAPGNKAQEIKGQPADITT